jgi:muramidase (phage lysozyme)
MARQKVRDISPARDIRPAAAPVNTYVRPAEPGRSPLRDVAEGLAAFDSGLSGFLKKRQAKMDDADKVRGAAAFYKANQAGYAEAVAQGLIPANSSPVFMQSYKAQQGNLAGIRLREKFNQSYLGWEGRNSNDPEQFQTFLSTFMAENIQTDDPDVLRGLTPHLESLTSDAMTVWGREAAASVEQGSLNTRGAVAGETIDYADATGLSSEQGTDYESLWSDLLAQREEALKAGHRSEDYDKVLVDTIADKAVEIADPQLLMLLDRKLPGSDVKLSSLPDFRDRKAQAMSALETLNNKRQTARDKAQQEADKQAEDAAVLSVMNEVAANPLAKISEEQIKEWEKYDPMARKKLSDMRKSMLEATSMEDPQDLITVERMIQGGATLNDIMELARDGVIRDPQTLKAALDRVEKRRKAVREGDGILSTQTAKRVTSTIRERTLPDDLTSMFDPGGTTDEGLEAIRDFEEMLMEWETANPNATLIDRENFINDTGELILKRINVEERNYTSPEDAAQMRQQEADQQSQARVGQEDDAMAQPVQPMADQQEAEAESRRKSFREAMEIDAGISRPREADTEAYKEWAEKETERIYAGDQPPSLDEMDASYRRNLEQAAERRGMQPEEFNMEIWKSLKKMLGIESEEPAGATAPDGTPVDNSSFNPDAASEEIGSAIDTAVDAGAARRATGAAGAAAPVLDLIGRTEGTDKGRGYNETLSYGAYTGGDVNLVGMTLGEIDKLQTDMLRHPDNSWNSSAIGRYQIVRTTLRKIKKQMGLKDDVKFTPEIQDQMAMHLLKGRGLDKWMAGKMSDKAFITNLSREWASLPKSSGGGYYKGQRAAVDPATVLSALQAYKSGKGGEAFDALLKPPAAYANIPADEVERFVAWNSDPVANHEENLKSIDTTLADVVRRAQELSKVKFVVGSGKRSKDLQKKAVEWGWSKTMNSDHLHGGAVDLWPLDENGAVKFTKSQQLEIVKAMKAAAKEKGVTLDIGAEWKSFKDLPHFAVKGGASA